MKLLAAIFFLALTFSPQAYGAETTPEDAYHDGNSTGSSGWDLDLGHDEELDELSEKQKAQLEEMRRKKEAEAKEKQEKNNDFFSSHYESIDRSISAAPDK